MRHLKEVADKSAIDEFWITDSSGHAYLTNTGIDFTFSPDPAKQPQASAFWPLIEGKEKIVVQQARKREIDDQVFKYVGVAGVDKPRIVQVGVAAKHLPGMSLTTDSAGLAFRSARRRRAGGSGSGNAAAGPGRPASGPRSAARAGRSRNTCR